MKKWVGCIVLAACMAFLISGFIGNQTAEAKKVRWDHYLFTGINHPVSIYLKGFADEVKKTVGKEDRLYQSLVTVISTYKKAYAEMEKLVDKGRRISELSIDGWKRD